MKIKKLIMSKICNINRNIFYGTTNEATQNDKQEQL